VQWRAGSSGNRSRLASVRISVIVIFRTSYARSEVAAPRRAPLYRRADGQLRLSAPAVRNNNQKAPSIISDAYMYLRHSTHPLRAPQDFFVIPSSTGQLTTVMKI